MDNEFDSGATHRGDDRPRGVSKAKLSDVDLGPKLSIFYRPRRNAAMQPLDASFPREAATIFCEHIRPEVEDSNSRSYVITGGDQASYQKILAWIKDCVQSQEIEKFPDIPEPENDPFTSTINVILAGDKLGIPAGSLSWHLKKRLNGCARKHLMPFVQVRQCYNGDSKLYELGLQEVACTSVFNAWWNARLDESVNPDLMEELSDMRDEVAELDNDLHEACKKREEEVRKKWAEKKAKKAAEEGRDEWGEANTEYNNTAGTNHDHSGGNADWNTPNNGPTLANTPATSEWEKENTTTSLYSLDHSTFAQTNVSKDWTGNESEPTLHNNNWADEMNEPMPEPPQTVPTMPW